MAFGVVAGRLLRPRHRSLQTAGPAQVIGQLGQPQDLADRQNRRKPAGLEIAHLVQGAVRQHTQKPTVTGRVQLLAGRQQGDAQHRGVEAVPRRLLLPVGQRPAGRLQHLPGPHQPLAVAGRQAGSGQRVAPRQ